MKSIYLPIGMLISVSIICLTLVSGNITLNHVPRIDKIVESFTYRYQWENGKLSVYLKSEIRGPDAYTDLIMLLNKNRDAKEIQIYLAGNGGSAESAVQLFYTIHSLKSKVKMIVRGDVYSSHAMIALAGDSIEILNPNILFLFHVPAAKVGEEYVKVEEYCEGETGKDRGISNKEKCEEFYKISAQSWKNTVEQLLITRILTSQEAAKYYQGHDIVLTGAQITERLRRIENGKPRN